MDTQKKRNEEISKNIEHFRKIIKKIELTFDINDYIQGNNGFLSLNIE